MDYTLIINDKKYIVQVEDINEAHLRLSIDGKHYSLSSHRLSSNQMQLMIDDGETLKNITSYVVKQTDGKRIQINGQVYHIQDEDIISRQASKKKSSSDLPDNITPPMPAVVIDTLVKPGDHVTKGQKVIVLSAMKMETTLVSPFDGIVKAVNASSGDKVLPGDILVEIERFQQI